MTAWAEALELITRVSGIRGAMVVSAADGMVVAESLMDELKGSAVAALAASLTGKIGRATDAAGRGSPRFLQMQATGGTLLVAPHGPDLLIVAVAERTVNAGLARLEMFRAAERVS